MTLLLTDRRNRKQTCEKITSEQFLQLVEDANSKGQTRLKIEGNRFDQEINLDHQELSFELVFKNCEFSSHVSFRNLQVKGLRLVGCGIETADFTRLQTEENFSLVASDKHWFSAEGSVLLGNASVGGNVCFDGGRFREGKLLDYEFAPTTRAAISAPCINIQGSLVVSDVTRETKRCGFLSQGLIDFSNAKIGGKVIARGARFIAGISFNIDGNTVFKESAYCWDYVFGEALNASIQSLPDQYRQEAEKTGSDLDRSPRLRFLSGDNYQKVIQRFASTVLSADFYETSIGGSVHFSYKTISVGTLRMGGCTISGKLSFKGSKLYEIKPVDGSHGATSSKPKFEYSRCREMARSIVYFGGTSLLAWGALDAVNIKVSRGIYLTSLKKNHDANNKSCENFCAFGRVSFVGSTIEGRLHIGGGHFFKSDDVLFDAPPESESKLPSERLWSNEGSRPFQQLPRHVAALDISNSCISLELLIIDNTVIVGRMNMDSVRVKSRFSFSRCNISSYQKDVVAVSARNCTFESLFEIVDSSLFVGCVNFRGSKFGSRVSIQNSIFSRKAMKGCSLYEKGSNRPEHKFHRIFTVTEDPTTPRVDFRETKNRSGYDIMDGMDAQPKNLVIPDIHEALWKSSRRFNEEWTCRKDRHLNSTLAVNFYQTEIVGDFMVSHLNEVDGLIGEGVKASACILGKLNLVESKIGGMLRLQVSDLKEATRYLKSGRFDLSMIFSPRRPSQLKRSQFYSKIPSILAVNLSGASVGTCNISKKILEKSALSISGFRYERLVGDILEDPDNVVDLVRKTIENYGEIDSTSAVRFLKYCKGAGHSESVRKLDAIVAVAQSTKYIDTITFLRRSIFHSIFTLLFVVCFAMTYSRVMNMDFVAKVLLALSALLYLFAVRSWLGSVNRAIKNTCVNTGARSVNQLKFIFTNLSPRLGYTFDGDWLRFSKAAGSLGETKVIRKEKVLDVIGSAFVGFGHGYVKKPLLLILSVWFLLTSVLAMSKTEEPMGSETEAALAENYKPTKTVPGLRQEVFRVSNALVASIEICMPTAGLITTDKEKKLAEGFSGEYEKILFSSTVILCKAIGWFMLSLLIAGYVKVLKDKAV